MTVEAKQARAEYMREWRARNKDKCKSYKDDYWQKKAEAAATQRKADDAETADAPSK